MRKMARWAAATLFLLGIANPVPAQSPVPPPAPDTPLRSPAELDQLVGPIALYPDPLIAELLPASTLPSQIVMADRYIGDGGDPSQIPSQDWDPSIQALAHYPTVLKWMDDNLPWTTQLGQAFENQQSDVMDAVQRLRAQAQNLGNLPTTPQESVANDDGDIEIEPANPDDMYVPDYSPDSIFYEPGVYCTFGFAVPLGGWLGYDWNWRARHLISWGPGHPRPRNWWNQTPRQRHDFIAKHPAPAWGCRRQSRRLGQSLRPRLGTARNHSLLRPAGRAARTCPQRHRRPPRANHSQHRTGPSGANYPVFRTRCATPRLCPKRIRRRRFRRIPERTRCARVKFPRPGQPR